jgi:hypothetical protein
MLAFLAAHNKCRRAAAAASVLKEASARAEAKVDGARAAFAQAARKRALDPEDEAAVKAAVERAEFRVEIDRDVRLAQLDPGESWHFHAVEGDYEPEHCSEQSTCLADDSFDGYWESEMDIGGDRRLCDACYESKDVETLAQLACDARKDADTNRNAEDVLYYESISDYYGDEAVPAVMARVRDADEWRALVLAAPPCIACEHPATHIEASHAHLCVCNVHYAAPNARVRKQLWVNSVNDPEWHTVARWQQCVACTSHAAHILVGQPHLRLCAEHFAARDTLHDALAAFHAAKLEQ